jgi:hypothetical protein
MSSKQQIAYILRECAWNLKLNGQDWPSEIPVSDKSSFICDTLGFMGPEYDAEAADEALHFLRELGMGTGFNEFGSRYVNAKGYDQSDFNQDQMFLRMWWLFFAADLAEELLA